MGGRQCVRIEEARSEGPSARRRRPSDGTICRQKPLRSKRSQTLSVSALEEIWPS